MLCEICRGSPIPGMVLTKTGPVPCPNGCIGGTASCCDGAGSAQPAPGFDCEAPPGEHR
jgi:hypothetical protein